MSHTFYIALISILISSVGVWKIMASGKEEIRKAFKEFRSNFFRDLKDWVTNPIAHQGLAEFSGMDVLGAMLGAFIVFVTLCSIFVFAALFGIYNLLL